jgi:AcrR family transcriptional regulator
MARVSLEAIRREQLLDAAIGLVATKGYDATTVRDIAAAADVATGSISYWFASRDDLLRAALVEAARRFTHRLDSAVVAAASPREELLAHAAAATPRTAEETAAQVVWIEFWHQAQRDPELRVLLERLYDSWRARLAATVRRGIATGAFRAVDADDWARRFVALADGLALHVLLHPGSMTADDMERIARDDIAATLHV